MAQTQTLSIAVKLARILSSGVQHLADYRFGYKAGGKLVSTSVILRPAESQTFVVGAQSLTNDAVFAMVVEGGKARLTMTVAPSGSPNSPILVAGFMLLPAAGTYVVENVSGNSTRADGTITVTVNHN